MDKWRSKWFVFLRIMPKWCGEVAVAKLHVTLLVRAAFDAVPWGELYQALLANGVPPALASAILQLQQSGFVLEWAGERSAFVFQPTTGTRQGCKLGPILYKLFVECRLNKLSASWIWVPLPTDPQKTCIGTEFGPDVNDRHHIHFLYALDANHAVNYRVEKPFLEVEMDIALEKNKLCANKGCKAPVAYHLSMIYALNELVVLMKSWLYLERNSPSIGALRWLYRQGCRSL
eukprot:6469210-Amphidinium_carterae.1